MQVNKLLHMHKFEMYTNHAESRIVTHDAPIECVCAVPKDETLVKWGRLFEFQRISYCIDFFVLIFMIIDHFFTLNIIK